MSDEIRGIRGAEGTVPPEWIDYNDHMNVAYYIILFDRCVDAGHPEDECRATAAELLHGCLKRCDRRQKHVREFEEEILRGLQAKQK